jgi:hypothetical protein
MPGMGQFRATAKRVSINGYNFALADDVRMSRITAEGQNIRLQGVQKRIDNAQVNKYPYDNWAEMGMGWFRMRREPNTQGQTRGVGGIKDSDAETRFGYAITPGLAPQTETHAAADADHVRRYQEFADDVWALWEGNYNTDAVRVHVGTFDSADDSWTGGINVESAQGTDDGIRACDMIVHGGNLTILHVEELGTNGAYGVSAKAAAYSNYPTGTTEILSAALCIRNNFDDDLGRLVSDGTNLISAIFDNVTNNEIRIHKTADAGDSAWTAIAQIPSTTGPKALVLWRDIFTAGLPIVPVLVTSENVYKVNISGTSLDPMLPAGVLTGGANTGRWATVAADSNLYVPLANGDIYQLRATGAQGGIEITNIGPATRAGFHDADGLVAARQGHANFLYGNDPRWLFVSYGGHASGKNASILAFDYNTANVDLHHIVLSSANDNIMRLHMAAEDTNSSLMQMFEQPLLSAVAGATPQSFLTLGTVLWAEDDMGDPHADSAAIASRMDVDGLTDATGATPIYIEHEYGTNGTTPSTVSNFGAIISSDSSLEFGRFTQNLGATDTGTPIGVSAKTIQHQLVLHGASDQPPQLKEFQYEAINKANVLLRFGVPIDIQGTLDIAEDATLDTEDIWKRIRDIQDSVVLVPFVFGEDGSDVAKTYYVRGDGPSEGIAPLESPGAVGVGAVLDQTERGGVFTLDLREVFK